MLVQMDFKDNHVLDDSILDKNIELKISTHNVDQDGYQIDEEY